MPRVHDNDSMDYLSILFCAVVLFVVCETEKKLVSVSFQTHIVFRCKLLFMSWCALIDVNTR